MTYIFSLYQNIDFSSLTSSERKALTKEVRKELKERIAREKQIKTLVKTFNNRI